CARSPYPKGYYFDYW
nr:immunoglobulin heavy chain junction region [Mus musculus]